MFSEGIRTPQLRVQPESDNGDSENILTSSLDCIRTPYKTRGPVMDKCS
jgi:hypothetical protein